MLNINKLYINTQGHYPRVKYTRITLHTPNKVYNYKHSTSSSSQQSPVQDKVKVDLKELTFLSSLSSFLSHSI